jgi:ubiquinone/menaquinone biosynthesis C-methylase UbiE
MTEAERIYYDRRAPEYDNFYLGTGLFAQRVRPGWHEELEAVIGCLRGFTMSPVIDVACGTGFLTRHLPGRVVAADQSVAMLRIARERLRGDLIQSDALQLPFRREAFACVMAGHFYGHLNAESRQRFLAEARRVAPQLLVIDAAWREGVQPEEMQERVLEDGSRHRVYKRYFTPQQLTEELGGGEVLFAGRWFVAVLD